MDSLENPRFRHSQEETNGQPLELIFEREAKILGEQQEAEFILFHYVIAAACRADTHLDIPLSLASYISKVNDLPSGRILEAAIPITPEENDISLSADRVVQLSEALAELAPDVKRLKSEDIADDGKTWITVQPIDREERRSKKEREDELWRHMETVPASYAEYKGKNPQEKQPRPVFYRVARIVIIALCFFVGMRIMGYSPSRLVSESSIIRSFTTSISTRIKSIFGDTDVSTINEANRPKIDEVESRNGKHVQMQGDSDRDNGSVQSDEALGNTSKSKKTLPTDTSHDSVKMSGAHTPATTNSNAHDSFSANSTQPAK